MDTSQAGAIGKKRHIMTTMMNIKFFCKEPTYLSFETAINETHNTARADRAAFDNTILRQFSIVDYGIMEDAVEFLLANKSILRIFIDGDNVDWQFIDERPFHRGNTPYDDELCLNLSEDKRILWTPEKFLRARLNTTGIAIAPTHTLVYLYVKGCDDLMFGQMIDLATNKQLLFYEES